MSLRFYVNGNTLAAQVYYANPNPWSWAVSGNSPSVGADLTSINGATSIKGSGSYALRSLFYEGGFNIGATGTTSFTLVKRIKFATFAANQAVWMQGWASDRSNRYNNLEYYITPAKEVLYSWYDGTGNSQQDRKTLTTAALTLTTTAWYDLMVEWDNDNKRTTLFLDGATAGVLTNALRFYGFQDDFTITAIPVMGFGMCRGVQASQLDIDELLVFDNKVTASMAGFFTGNARTSYYPFTTSPSLYTDPGVANVLSGTAYTFNGTTQTGTYHDPTYTDPGVANVLSGTSYIFNDATLTGTLVAGGTYTDPGVANVKVNTSYIFNDSTLTGTLAVPEALTGSSSTVPLAQIKEQVRFALAENNTSTGAPVLDLSNNLNEKVGGVFKLNPELIPLLGNVFPAVTVYTQTKEIDAQGIVKNQANAKRKANITLQIAGMVWTPNFTSNRTVDPADDQCEYLMENIERILRSYDNLGGEVSWQFPDRTEYFSATFEEESHMRVGVLNLQASVFY